MYRGTAADGGQQRYRAEFTGIPGVRDSTRASAEQARPPNMFKVATFCAKRRWRKGRNSKRIPQTANYTTITLWLQFFCHDTLSSAFQSVNPHTLRNGSFCGRLWKQDKLTAAKRIEPGESILFFPSTISFSDQFSIKTLLSNSTLSGIQRKCRAWEEERLTTFARRNKVCVFSLLCILKLGLSPEIPNKGKRKEIWRYRKQPFGVLKFL